MPTTPGTRPTPTPPDVLARLTDGNGSTLELTRDAAEVPDDPPALTIVCSHEDGTPPVGVNLEDAAPALLSVLAAAVAPPPDWDEDGVDVWDLPGNAGIVRVDATSQHEIASATVNGRDLSPIALRSQALAMLAAAAICEHHNAHRIRPGGAQ